MCGDDQTLYSSIRTLCHPWNLVVAVLWSGPYKSHKMTQRHINNLNTQALSPQMGKIRINLMVWNIQVLILVLQKCYEGTWSMQIMEKSSIIPKHNCHVPTYEWWRKFGEGVLFLYTWQCSTKRHRSSVYIQSSVLLLLPCIKQ